MKPSTLAISVIVAAACVLARPAAHAAEVSIVVSIPDQKLAVIQNGVRIGKYSISTSKFGLGNRPSSFATPLGLLTVASKVGAGAPSGLGLQGTSPDGRNPASKCAGPRPDRDPHPSTPRTPILQHQSVRPGDLHPWNNRGVQYRPPCEFWVHSDAIPRCAPRF